MTDVSVLKIQINNLYYKRESITLKLEKLIVREDKKLIYFGNDHESVIYLTNEDFDYYHSKIRKFYKENNLSGQLTVIKGGKLIKKKFKFRHDNGADFIGD